LNKEREKKGKGPTLWKKEISPLTQRKWEKSREEGLFPPAKEGGEGGQTVASWEGKRRRCFFPFSRTGSPKRGGGGGGKKKRLPSLRTEKKGKEKRKPRKKGGLYNLNSRRGEGHFSRTGTNEKKKCVSTRHGKKKKDLVSRRQGKKRRKGGEKAPPTK